MQHMTILMKLTCDNQSFTKGYDAYLVSGDDLLKKQGWMMML